jgi:hypothetical protein
VLKSKLANNTNCVNTRPEVETLLATRDNRAGAVKS